MADTTGPAPAEHEWLVLGDWLTVEVGSCTCAAPDVNGQVVHERRCGPEPVISLGELETVLRRAGRTVVETTPATGITDEMIEAAARAIRRGTEVHADATDYWRVQARDALSAALVGRTVVDTAVLVHLRQNLAYYDERPAGVVPYPAHRVVEAARRLAAESSGEGESRG